MHQKPITKWQNDTNKKKTHHTYTLPALSKNNDEEIDKEGEEEEAGVSEVTYLNFQLIQNVFMVEVFSARANVSHTRFDMLALATMCLLAEIYIQM